MKSKRKPVPKKTKELILREAGYRCAIPTCRAFTYEIAHIRSYKESENNDFQNLIALCPNCHTRFDKGEIPITTIRAYKHNLLLLNSRYVDAEKRILDIFIKDINTTHLVISDILELMYKQLIDDGFFIRIPGQAQFDIGGYSLAPSTLMPTTAGQEFIKNIREAQKIT